MQLVEDVVLEGEAGPLRVLPSKGVPVDDLGRAVDPLGLVPGGRIGALHLPVQAIPVKGAGRSLLRHPDMVPPRGPFERHGRLPRGEKAYLHPLRCRGIDKKPATAVPERGRAQFQPVRISHPFLASLFKNTAARGGTTMVSVYGRPCDGDRRRFHAADVPLPAPAVFQGVAVQAPPARTPRGALPRGSCASGRE